MTIHEALLGVDGKVFKGAALTDVAAAARRKVGQDVVVCGDDIMLNQQAARAIENQVGPAVIHGGHVRAGPYALPHWQQKTPPPTGHCFFETDKRKAFDQP